MLIDNKKTREISWNDFELEGNKENLIKQGWESFEPYGNKPNLIPNGWDSFRPYGSGKNYVENWDFTGDMVYWGGHSKTEDNTVIIRRTWDLVQSGIDFEKGKYIIRVKYRPLDKIEEHRMRLDLAPTSVPVDKRISYSEWSRLSDYQVAEWDIEFTDDVSDVNIIFLSGLSSEQGYIKFEIDWVQITPIDNQHLVVEKTPLENGLTRIQTWGGNNILKLLLPYDNQDITFSQSMYVESIKNNFIFRHHQSETNVEVTKRGFYHISGKKTDKMLNNMIQIRALSADDNLDFIATDPQVVEGDKPNMAYSIQELDNDLYRIRSWGGEHDMKFKSPNFGQLGETGTDMTISLYVENNSDSMIMFSNNLAIGGVPYPDGAEYMITVPREYKGFAYLKGEQVGRDVELDIRSDGNIDMIVSQPEIIEGHDLNAMLLIEDLDDGRKHVQVHNVNENTKLVYTGGDVIKGEPYTLETEIENDGRIFNLSANMFDSVVEVQKGMNDIRKSGELQDKELKIEIGVD